MSEDEIDRIEGVDFTDIGPILEDIPYPITSDELVAQYGDCAIERTNAEPITIRELYDPMVDDTSESIEALRQSMLTLMPKESVGRQRYSDRGLTIDDPNEHRRQDRPLPGHNQEDEQL